MAQWTANDIPSLDGKVALITGANAGLGLATTKALAARGATVLLACRNPAKAQAAADEVRAVTTGPVELVTLDLSSLDSVRAAVATVVGSQDRLDFVVNNAGLMALDELKTEDGFEMQFGVNHLGHFVLNAGLAPLVLATPGSRFATMSSFGHRPGRIVLDDLQFERRRYNRWIAYFQSKLANLMYSNELQRRLTGAGHQTLSIAAHPGGAHTDLGHEGSGITNTLMKPVMMLGQSTERGSLPILRALTDPAAVGGTFYGPRFMLQGPAVLETPARQARNLDKARALWERSEALTNTSFDLTAA